MKKVASNSPNYRAFVKQRDQALDLILNKYLRAYSRILKSVEDETVLLCLGVNARNPFVPQNEVELRIKPIFERAIQATWVTFLRMRNTSYVIAHTGEAEALGRANKSQAQFEVRHEDLNDMFTSDSPSGGALFARIRLYYIRVMHSVLEAYQLGKVLEEKPDELSRRIVAAFPRKKIVKRPKRQLKPVKAMEAKRQSDTEAEFITDLSDQRVKDLTEQDMANGYVEQDAWDTAVADYIDKDIPTNKVFGRGPRDVYDVEIGEPELEERYGWELEQEAVQDFVQKVRDGQVDAAEKNGITDFMWIAVIDDKTDECCTWRDGLTSTEIEEQLKSGHKNDECDATVPPAHFNCRCTVAPVTKDFPDTVKEDFGDFDEWLNS